MNTMSTKFLNLMAFVWSHPILTCCIFLLLTPPLFHVFVYFSPLLISTALFVVAIVSIQPHFEDTIKEQSRDQMPMKSENGVEIHQEEHSQCKRICGKPTGSKEELPWLDWVKMAEEIGRSWADTHLKVECASAFCEVNALPGFQTTAAAAIEPVQVENEELEKELQSNDRPVAAETDLSSINLTQEGEANLHQTLESVEENLVPAGDSEPPADAEIEPDRAVEEERTLICLQEQTTTPHLESAAEQPLSTEGILMRVENMASSLDKTQH